ncbi:MAG: N-acetylneuraminate synthase [Patescibacteria group bacterium]
MTKRAGKIMIIAEAGVNHNGSLVIAKKMIDRARQAGADWVKFQTFKTESLVSKRARKADYQKRNLKKSGSQDETDTQFEMLKKLELSEAQFVKLKKYCEKLGIGFLSTPFDEESADLLEKMGIGMYKIPSGEITNLPFLKHVARKGKPIIMSTGMADLAEVKEALRVIYAAGNRKVTVLHCTTEYPAPFREVNLMAMITMRKSLKVPVGYSDHTPGIEVSIAAAALGACVIEKHFTLNKKMEGPDHRASLEPHELEAMVRSIRNIEKALGDGIKRPSQGEKKVALVARKSVVAVRDLKKGAEIREEDIGIKRPGDGIAPKYFKKVIGKRAKRNIREGDTLKWKMLMS